MTMLLNDIKIVDLKRSDWDKDASRPKLGRYTFRTKVYLKKTDYNDAATRPAHVLKWVEYTDENNYERFLQYQKDYQAEAVTVDDPYWPEPLRTNGEGNYTFKDCILMKIPLLLWLEKKYKDKKKYDGGHKLADAGFRADVPTGESFDVPPVEESD